MNFKKEKSTYKSIFKANALFGGLQLYQILIRVIRSKFIAVLLGPAGVGMLGLYTSATRLISEISSMGLSNSAIRDVSEAYGTGDIHSVSRTMKIVSRLIWFTGLLGTLVVILLAPILSQTSFGNNDYTIPFMVLSVTLLMDQLCAGQKVLLQGTHRLKDLAKASAIGSTIGLVVSIPLYYLLGINGIVPTLILYSLISLCISWYYSRRIKVENVEISYQETFKEGAGMLKFGLALCLSGVLASASTYILRSYISHVGGTADVGLYVAGAAIVNTYVGMVFTAISTDYYPRLAAVNKDNNKCRIMVNEQGEIATLIMAPLLLSCIVFMPIVVRILYSDEFLGANDYIIWAVCGMLFKLASWVVGFLFVAKAESKLFVINEFSVSVYGLILAILGYMTLGLKGLGIAFLVEFIIYAMITYVIAHKRYHFYFSPSFISIFVVQMILLFGCLMVVIMTKSVLWMYIFGSVFVCASAFYSFKGLNDRIGLVSMIRNKINGR